MRRDESSEIEAFRAGRVATGPDGRYSIPAVVSDLVELALASPRVLEEIPYLNDDWIKIAGFRRRSMDISVDGTPIVPAVIKDLLRLGLQIREPSSTGPTPPDWPSIWRALAVALRVHVDLGRRHLLTEDAVRFATVAVLAEHGVTADRLAVERTVAGIGRVDLLVDTPAAAIEFKFPREPSERNAAHTMTFGEVLRDFYRLARVRLEDAWAVQLFRPAFGRFLARRTELHWTTSPGDTLVLPEGLPAMLPGSARARLPDWAGAEVRATCILAERLGEDLLVAYRVEGHGDG